MIFILSLLAVFGLGRCLDQLPTKYEIQASINRTIDEVERLIQGNNSLPQLSRGQIVDILYNITSKEMNSVEETVQQTRDDYQRALMVVLPYNSRDAKNEDIKDLFTKPPIVQMIPDTETMLPFASIQAENIRTQSKEQSSDYLDNFKYSSEINDELSSDDNFKNHGIDFFEGESESEPEKFSFVLKDLKIPDNDQRSTGIALEAEFANEQNGKNDPTQVKLLTSILPTVSSSIMNENQSETIRETSLKSANDVKPTLPSKTSTNILTFDQWKYFAPPATFNTPQTTEKPITSTTTEKHLTSTIKSQNPSTMVSKPKPFTASIFSTDTDKIKPLTSPSSVDSSKTPIDEPEFARFDIPDYEMMNDEPAAPIFVTPMPSKKPVQKYFASTLSPATLASVSSSTGGHKANKGQHFTNKLDGTLLDILGIDSKKNKLYVEPEKINFTAYKDSQLSGDSELPKLTTTGFDNNQISFIKGVNKLTPDIRQLFHNFGLETSDKGKERENVQVTTTTQSPVRSLLRNSWSSFKPLPRSQVRDESMRDFLAQFGLGVENRREKSIKTDPHKRQSIVEVVPSNMKSILQNMGLLMKTRVNKTSKKITSRSDTKIDNILKVENVSVNSNAKPSVETYVNSNDNSNHNSDKSVINHSNEVPKVDNVELNHVFKPHKTQLSNQKQKQKINELLDTVKLVQEGKAEVGDVRRVAHDLLETAKTLKAGPDPLSLEEIIKTYNEGIRNEVKRQNENNGNYRLF